MGEPAARVQALTSMGNKAAADRRIWLVADDYGISRAVNAAIRDLLERGAINATSVMVVASGFDDSEAAKLNSLRADAAIGLHLTLTAPFRPLSEGYAPLHGAAFCRCGKRSWPLVAAAERCGADAGNRGAGRPVYGGVRPAAGFHRRPSACASVSADRRVPAVRGAAVRARRMGTPMRARFPSFSDRKGVVLDLLSRHFRRLARAFGVRTNRPRNCSDPADKAAAAAGMEQVRAGQRAFRLAEMRRRLGITQAQVAVRMGITQGRLSAIEHAKPGTTEPRTWPPPSKPSAAAWRSSPTSATSGSPSPNLAPKQPDLISNRKVVLTSPPAQPLSNARHRYGNHARALWRRLEVLRSRQRGGQRARGRQHGPFGQNRITGSGTEGCGRCPAPAVRARSRPELPAR